MVTDLVNQTGDVMLKLTEFVMAFAPYGILALVANMVGSLGASMLKEVGRFIITDYIGLIIISVVEYPLLLKLIGKLSPARFYRNVAPVMLVAASTTSSNATLPAGMNAAQEAEGVPEKVYGFTLPLGATVNMDGMANAIGVIAVFACNLYGMKISPALIFEFVFLSLVLSTGCAGVKGAGIVMSGVLLQTLGMPLTLLPVLAAVWPILDIGHTTMNVAGDHVGTCIVANRLGMLDQDVFYGRKQASTKTA
jgi:Na+/H+-dicarboxylate symporter